MGYSANISPTSASLYSSMEHARATRSVSRHTADIHEGRISPQVHKAMNPHGVRRESRDSTAHPNSVAIGVMFDVTGSMGTIPREVQRRLVNLMTLLTTRNYVTDPQVLFGAIGDATCDGGPMQVGQFESGLDMDKDLERVWVESGGGGGKKESYELAHYFFARHVVTDCWDKRNKKGYLFTMGDEAPYENVSRRHAHGIFGDTLQADLPLTEVLTELQTKWHVFHLLMETGTSIGYPHIEQTWRGLLPEGHVINLRDAKNVGEVIAMVVGMNEGTLTNPEHDLKQLGEDGESIRAVVKALAPLASSRGIVLRS